MQLAASIYQQIRTVFGALPVRHNGNQYQAVGSNAAIAWDGSGIVLVEGAQAAFRLLVSELKTPYPAIGDDIQVRDSLSGNWIDCTVMEAQPQHTGDTLLIQYATKYGA